MTGAIFRFFDEKKKEKRRKCLYPTKSAVGERKGGREETRNPSLVPFARKRKPGKGKGRGLLMNCKEGLHPRRKKRRPGEEKKRKEGGASGKAFNYSSLTEGGKRRILSLS